MRLTNQVALVTGGSHGLGLAIGRALAVEGAAIACLARAGAELDRAVETLRATGSAAIAAPADVTNAAQVEGAVQKTLEQWGRLDILVLNAGTWKGAATHETSEELWDQLLDLNLKGAFLALRSALPWMRERGRGTIVGIASLGAFVGQPGASAYAASKWGLRGLLESVALEVKPRGIRVSIVAPHSINSAGGAIDPASEERRHHLEPAEVAALVAHICVAPDHVSIGNVSVWPVGAGIRSEG